MGRGNNVRNRWPIVVSSLLAFALAVVSAPVGALGLGQIEVLSRPGEPLVAEIPVITTDPAELRQLQARLASPETFRRIGLEPPQGAVSNLQFSVALDAQGNPVVRVTSPAPIDQPLLTFLLEVDWGQGRLVREYSVLVDAPESAVAIAQPPIQAPRPAPPSTVVRPPEAVQPVATTPEVTAEPLPPAPQSTQAQPVPQQVPVPPPASVVAPPPPRQPAAPGEYAVAQGDTLSEIAAGLGLGDYSLNQTMLALLRANPDAFIDGNINLVRAGAVLRIPGRDVLAELSPSEANAVVQAQVRSWRDRQAPPVIAADAVSEGAGADNAEVADRDADADPASDGPEVADARLQIVPPAGEDGQAPGSRSGLSAGGEGDMLRNDLRQANEDLAARDAEVEELRARLAEAEALQRKQAQLLDLKDSELAAVQQRLAESRADGTPADPADAQATVAQPGRDASASPLPLPWLVGGLLLLLAAAAAWWWTRRRPAPVAATPAPRRNYDTAAMAAGLAATGRDESGARAPQAKAPPAKAPPAAAPPVRSAPPAPPAAVAPPPAPAERTPEPIPTAATPTPATVDVPPPPADDVAPTWHAGVVPVVADPPAAPDVPLDARGQAHPAGRDGLELARAYLDLGDHQAARTLLREVLLGRDPGAREEAARMLREIG